MNRQVDAFEHLIAPKGFVDISDFDHKGSCATKDTETME